MNNNEKQKIHSYASSMYLCIFLQTVGHSRQPPVGFVRAGVSGLVRWLGGPDAGPTAGTQPPLGEEVCGLRCHAGAR